MIQFIKTREDRDFILVYILLNIVMIFIKPVVLSLSLLSMFLVIIFYILSQFLGNKYRSYSQDHPIKKSLSLIGYLFFLQLMVIRNLSISSDLLEGQASLITLILLLQSLALIIAVIYGLVAMGFDGKLLGTSLKDKKALKEVLLMLVALVIGYGVFKIDAQDVSSNVQMTSDFIKLFMIILFTQSISQELMIRGSLISGLSDSFKAMKSPLLRELSIFMISLVYFALFFGFNFNLLTVFSVLSLTLFGQLARRFDNSIYWTILLNAFVASVLATGSALTL